MKQFNVLGNKLVISFRNLSQDEQYEVYNGLIGKEIIVNGSHHTNNIKLKGVLECKGLYLGGIIYDLKSCDQPIPSGFNLLYNVEGITVLSEYDEDLLEVCG